MVEAAECIGTVTDSGAYTVAETHGASSPDWGVGKDLATK